MKDSKRIIEQYYCPQGVMKDQDLFIKELIQLFPSLKEELLDEDC